MKGESSLRRSLSKRKGLFGEALGERLVVSKPWFPHGLRTFRSSLDFDQRVKISFPLSLFQEKRTFSPMEKRGTEFSLQQPK